MVTKDNIVNTAKTKALELGIKPEVAQQFLNSIFEADRTQEIELERQAYEANKRSLENIKKDYYRNKIYIETTSNPDTLIKRIKDLKIVGDEKIFNRGVICILDDKVNKNLFLKKLIEIDEKIIEFSEVKTSLEDIFIRLTDV